MADLEVRDLTADHHDQALNVRLRSFGPLPAGASEWWRTHFERMIANRRALGVFVGDELLGTARIHQYRQLWGGRALPMAGLAGVVVAPEWRGRGVARQLLIASMERAIELGDALSVLFPAVVTPYRRLGWEIAGVMSRTTFAAETLRRLEPATVPVRGATDEDIEPIVALVSRDAVRTRACGPLELTDDDVKEMIADANTFCYVAADGFLAYGWDGKDLRVERLVAESPETTRALWSVVGSGASVVRSVSTFLPMHDAVHWILDGKAELPVDEDRWMLRILDVGAATEGRGFPSGLTIDVPMLLTDKWVEANAGGFRLVVDDGSGRLEPEANLADADAVNLGPNGLAALYAGTPMTTLRRGGLATGGDQHDARLDAAFGARSYLMDSF